MSDGINWGGQGINWGLFAPQSNPAANQGMSAFADQQRQAEQRRQFDMSHQLRVQENARQANQFDRSFGLQQQEFDQRRTQFDQTHSLAKSQDKRASDLHGYAVREKQDALDERGYERLKDANDLVQNAKTPEERQAVIDLGKSLGMNVDRYATSPNHFRLLQEGMRRRMAEEDAKRAEVAAKTDKTKADAEQSRAHAGLFNAQADKERAKQEDPMTMLEREFAQRQIEKMRGGQSTPTPTPQPQGSVIPQSAPMEQGDPNLIPTQASQPAQRRDEPIVKLPAPYGDVPKSFAEILMTRAAREKNAQMYDMIGQAIGKLPKSMEDDVGKPLLAAINQRSRVEGIMDTFKDEWLTWEEWADQKRLGIMDSVGVLRKNITPEQRQRMSAYNEWQTLAFRNLNEYVKEVTGAAMGIQEEKRIRKGTIDPEKDSPQQFRDKSLALMKDAGLMEARMRYMMKNGLQFDRATVHQTFPLERMQDIIDQRATELRKTMTDVPKPERDAIIRRQLKVEFNI